MLFRASILSIALATSAHAAEPIQLPTGVSLDPAAPSHPAGSLPLNAVISPDGQRVVLLLCGWREEGVQIIDRESGALVQMIDQPAAFVGLAFSPDGSTLWASGGDDDSIFRYAWRNGVPVMEKRIELLHKKTPKDDGQAYPAGLALSADGRRLYVAENLGDALTVIDTTTNEIVQRLNTDRYPYAVVVGAKGEVYVSCWGDDTIDVFTPTKSGLSAPKRIDSVRHPSALVLSSTGSTLYVASATTDTIGVIDTKTRKLVRRISDAPPAGPQEGSTPNALALSRDGKRLFVAEADNNAVAIIDLVTNKLAGRIPVEWYPSALALHGDELIVVSAKGKGTAPNPKASHVAKLPPRSRDYTLGQLDSSVMTISASPSADALKALTARVAKANRWTASKVAAKYPPFKHVMYIIKENRTYDQILGDMTAGDGDPSLLFFGRDSAPNHHALAERFGLFDRFFVNAEVSAQGHNWSTAAYSSDYVEKTTPTVYAKHGRTYDYEGSNRDRGVDDDDDDVASPSTGYLWDVAARKGITYRNYGNFIATEPKIRPLKRALVGHTNLAYPGFDLNITDQSRFDLWKKDFDEDVRNDSFPALEMLWLPNDHTAGTQPNKPTPRAYMADNDLALGRIIETLSNSRYWRDTVVFVLEDDAQSGPDHVDSHRSPLFVVSAYNRPGTNHLFANTTDVIGAIEEILGLGKLSKFDHYARSLHSIFAATADLTPYSALMPTVDMKEMNPPEAPKTSLLIFSKADSVDDDELNRVLWVAIKGDAPYPGPTRGSMRSLWGVAPSPPPGR